MRTMEVFINKIVINGAKSINKPIELLFTNKTIKADMSLTDCNVKAIYGPNGSGKSGIISAIYVYQRLIDDNDGLSDKYFSKFVYELINKETKKLSIEIIFTIIANNSSLNCYKHNLELTTNNDREVSITKEEIYVLKGKSIKDENFTSLVLIENGIIKSVKTEKGYEIKDDPLYVNSLNLLDKHSLTNIACKLFFANKAYSRDNALWKSLISTIILSLKMTVVLNNEDMHQDYISNKITIEKYSDEEKFKELFLSVSSFKSFMMNLSIGNKDIVDINSFTEYEENIKKLESFIKIFKPDLDEIIIEKKVNDDKYYCEKIFRYGNKQVSVEFESTGIKKLVRLYSAFYKCANSGIVFIDEMDANLHDVYFTRLIEFFKNDSQGQLCFTTHNLEPINVLKDNAHSLDFISTDSRIYSWTKDGNKSPMSKYINGLIPYSPFNVESFDFDVLLDEE